MLQRDVSHRLRRAPVQADHGINGENDYRSMTERAYAPILAHGLIGDQRTAALVAADGTIDWYCLLRFDGDVVFGSLLDAGSGGCWRLGPRKSGHGRQTYVGETAVLRTCWNNPEYELELLDAMVMTRDASGATQEPLLLRRLRVVRGQCDCTMHIEARLNFRDSLSLRAQAADVAAARNDKSPVLWTSDARVTHACVGSGNCSFVLAPDQEFWTVLSGSDAQAPHWSVQRARECLEETADSWRRWAHAHPWVGPRRQAVLASQRVIRLLGHAHYGSQVAAATTSLPEKVGSDRNYDYRFAWVRDSSLALAILAVFGDLGAAEHYMDWLAQREPGAQMPLQVLYRIDGSTDAQERALHGVDGYCGSRPVRIGNHAATQFQLDSLGYFADCALIYLQQGGRWKPEYSELLERVADFTVSNWHLPDHGIWELDERRHYTTSKAMGWVALERSCRVRKHLHEPVPAQWEQARDAIHREVLERAWSEELQSFRQHYDAEEVDASVLLLSLMDFLPAHHPKMVATVAAIQRHLQHEGFVWRFHPRSVGRTELPLDGLEAAFLPCTFWLASALARMGRSDEAQDILERVEHACGDPGLYPEEFDPRHGCALGNHPLLFSHAEHLRAVMDLAKAGPIGMAQMVAGRAAGAISRALHTGQ